MTFSLADNRIMCIFLCLVSIMFFAQGLSYHGIEYRDDEIFYFNSTKEMFADKNFLSPVYFGENRFQKPILFYWLILASYQLSGVSWFAARFISVVAASLTVVLTWLIAAKLFDKKTASLSAIVLATLPMFFRHAKNVVPDMTMNLFIVLAVYYMLKFFDDPSAKRYSYLFFVSCALGFMIKGFAALVIPILALIAYALLTKKTFVLSKINFSLGMLLFLVIVLPWFLYMAYIHGETYVHYMLKTETLDRAVQSQQNVLLGLLSTFKNNTLFYLQTIMSYFSPWSIFGLAAIPLMIVRVRKKTEGKEPLMLILTWFFTVFLFFCFIAHRINHLILVLTSPFAVLVSYFFLVELDYHARGARLIAIARKYLVIVIVFFGLLGISFVKVYLLGATKLWLLTFLIFFLLSIFIIQREKKPIIIPLMLGMLLLYAFSQTSLLSQARFTAHSSMQEFARTINRDPDPLYVIAVGSHDLHEKEFQVYFERKIKKIANSDTDQTGEMLTDFFEQVPKSYCLITQNDYEKHLKKSFEEKFEIIQEDYVFRRRIAVDRDFFIALLKIDQDKIHHTFMEKVLLLKKESRG